MAILLIGPEGDYDDVKNELDFDEEFVIVNSLDKAFCKLKEEELDKIVSLDRDIAFEIIKNFNRNNIPVFVKEDDQLIQLKKNNVEDQKDIDFEVLDYSIESLSSGFAVADLDGKLLKVNQAFIDMWGYEYKDEVICKPVLEFWKDIGDTKKVISILQEKGEWTGEMKARKKEGLEFYVEVYASLVKDEDGRPVAMTANFIDVTDRRKMKEDLKDREKRFRKITENAHDLIAELDMDANFIYANKTHEDITGYAPEEMMGENAIDYLHPDYSERALKKFAQAIKERNQRIELKEYRFRCKDGSYKWFNTVGTVISDEDMNPQKVQIITRDITERKKAKEELRRSKNRFQTLISNAQEGIYIRKLDGTITYVNQKFADIHGYDKEELIGKQAWKLKHPDSRNKVDDEEQYNEKLVDGEKSKEIKILTKEGEVRNVLCTNSLIENESSENEVFGIIHDISDRKKAEERVQFLLTLLRHDLKNKTQVVRGYLQILEDYELEDEVQNIVDKAIEGIIESQDLIKKVGVIKDIDRSVDVREVNLRAHILTAVDNFDSIAEEKNFDIEYESLDHNIEAGPLLEEMFSNLIENSIKHSDGDLIRISGEETDEDIIVTFEDNGVGIVDDKKQLMFERGKKGKGSSGLGMGMYLVKRIVEVYGGEIEVKDSDLGGARFDIYFNKS